MVNPEDIYARALAMRWIDPDSKFEGMLEFEMAPHPTSMFDQNSLPRPCKQKSKLTNNLKVEIPARLATNNAVQSSLTGMPYYGLLVGQRRGLLMIILTTSNRIWENALKLQMYTWCLIGTSTTVSKV